MLAKTHLVFALLIGLLTFEYFNLNPFLFIIIISLTSFLPDIDHPKSKIGRRFFVLSYPINFLLGHRKFFHSMTIALGLSFAFWYFFGGYYIPFLMGFLSHLIADGLTKQGIDFTYPFDFFKIRGFIKTGGFAEKIILIILVLIDFYLILKLFF